MNGQTPPRGNQSSNGHSGGRSCPEGCTCGRHSRKRGRPRQGPRENCEIVDKEGPCENAYYTKSLGPKVCKKHHARFTRFGRWDVVNKMPPKKAKEPVKPKLVKAQRYCLCSHGDNVHREDGHGGCTRNGCRCLKFHSTDSTALRRSLAQLRDAGFSDTVQDTAYCDACRQWIRIGRWYDPIVLRRALIHSRRECPALRRGRHPA